MSSNIKDLEVHIPLRALQSCEPGKYINVSQYKKLNITTYCDVTLTLTFTASHDSLRDGPKHTFVISPFLWETVTINIVLPYIKLEYERTNLNDQTISNELIVICNGHLKRGFSIHPPEDEKKKSRRWSFLNKSPSTKTNDSEPIEIEKKELPEPHLPPKQPPKTDSRIPDLILPNTLFVGGKGNKVVALPPGQIGQILQYTESGIRWV